MTSMTALLDRFARTPGDLTEAELESIADALDADSQLAAELLADCETSELLSQTHGLDRQHFKARMETAIRPRSGRFERRFARTRSRARIRVRRKRRSNNAIYGVALAFLLAVAAFGGGALLLKSDNQPVQKFDNENVATDTIDEFDNIDISQVGVEQSLALGQRIELAQDVSLEAQSPCVLTIQRYSREGLDLQIASGGLEIAVPRGYPGEGIGIDLPHGSVHVTGTTLTCVAEPTESRVYVSHGKVSIVSADNKQTSVEAGSWSCLRPGLPPAVFAQQKGSALVIAGIDDEVKDKNNDPFVSLLRRHGFAVTSLLPDECTPALSWQFDLVVISPSARRNEVTPSNVDLDAPVPILHGELNIFYNYPDHIWPAGFEMLGEDDWARVSSIQIVDPNHPLSGGLSGSVRIFDGNERIAAFPSSRSAVAITKEKNRKREALAHWEITTDNGDSVRRAMASVGHESMLPATPANWHLVDHAIAWLMNGASPP